MAWPLIALGAVVCSANSHCQAAGSPRREKDQLGCPKSPAVRARHASWTQRQHNAALRCLQNKTIWVLGNSISRSFAFQLQKMLRREAPWEAHTAANMSAQHEQDTAASKEQCGSGSDVIDTWNVTAIGNLTKSRWPTATSNGFHPNLKVRKKDCWGVCECHFDVTRQLGSEARLVFGWHFEISGGDHLLEVLTHGLSHKGDRVSRPPDILVLNAGFPRGVIPDTRGVYGGEAAAAAGAPKLAAIVRQALSLHPHMHFYWRSSTFLCNSSAMDNMHAALNPEVDRMNTIIESHLCNVTGALKLDGLAWTNGQCDGYEKNDPIHHSALAFSQVTTLLAYECGIPEEDGACLRQ